MSPHHQRKIPEIYQIEPCKFIDLNFLQIYTGIGSAGWYENRRHNLSLIPYRG